MKTSKHGFALDKYEAVCYRWALKIDKNLVSKNYVKKVTGDYYPLVESYLNYLKERKKGIDIYKKILNDVSIASVVYSTTEYKKIEAANQIIKTKELAQQVIEAEVQIEQIEEKIIENKIIENFETVENKEFFEGDTNLTTETNITDKYEYFKIIESLMNNSISNKIALIQKMNSLKGKYYIDAFNSITHAQKVNSMSYARFFRKNRRTAGNVDARLILNQIIAEKTRIMNQRKEMEIEINMFMIDNYQEIRSVIQ